MCAHTACAWSLLNLTVTSSNSRSQAKPQIVTIRRCEHFWDTFCLQDVCCCSSANCNMPLLFVLFLLYQTLFDFQRRNLFNFSLGSTSLMHCDRKFLEELYCTCHLCSFLAFQLMSILQDGTVKTYRNIWIYIRRVYKSVGDFMNVE